MEVGGSSWGMEPCLGNFRWCWDFLGDVDMFELEISFAEIEIVHEP